MKRIFGFYTRVPLVLRILVGLLIGVVLGLFVKNVDIITLLGEIKFKLTADATDSEAYPFLDYVHNSELTGRGVDKDIEVTLKAVLKRSELKELGHNLVGINSAAEIKRELESAEVYLVTEISDLLQLSFLHKLGDPLHYHFYRGRVGDLDYVYAVFSLVVIVS